MRRSKFVEDIKKAVQSGTLKQPFRSSDVKSACPTWAEGTYHSFLPKHRKGNPGGYKEYFIRHPDGSYGLI